MMQTWKNKTGFHEWLLINALKHREDSEVPLKIEIHDPERRKVILDGNTEVKLNLLAEIAKKKFSEGTIFVFNAAFAVSILLVAFLLLGLYWKFGSDGTLPGSAKLENDDKIVNVGPFLLFLIPQYVFLVLTLVLTLLAVLGQPLVKLYALFGKTGQPHRRASSFLSTLVYLSSVIGAIVFALQWGIVRMLSFLMVKIWKKDVPFESLAAQFQDKPHLRGAVAGILTNSLWIVSASLIVLAFIVQSYGHENHFYWRATFPSMKQRADWVKQIEYYATRFSPLYEPLTEDEIQNVVNRRQPDLDATTGIESEKWSHFIIHSFLVAIVLRGLMGGFHLRRYQRGKNDFKPDPNDEFFRNLIAKILATGEVHDETERSPETYPEDSSLKMAKTESKVLTASGPKKTLIFMYDLDIPEAIWQEWFPEKSHREIYDAEKCKGDEGEIIQNKINDGKVAVGKIVFAFDITDNPSGGKLSFVQEIASGVMEQTYVLLSRSEALRRQKEGNASAIENRKKEWTDKLEQIGVPREQIIDYFDHEINDAKTRRRLTALFRGDQEKFHLAGKYAEASEIILAGVREIFDEFEKTPQTFASDLWNDRPAVDERLLSYRGKIAALYAQEGKTLNAFIGKLAASVDVNEIKEMASEKFQQLGDNAISESIAWARWWGGVSRTLGTRCCLAGVGLIPSAALGMALGTAAVAVAGPLAVLGVVGVAGGFFAPEAINKLKKAAFRQELLKTTNVLPSETDEAKTNFHIEVSMFTASLATWAVVHELQGLPPEELAIRLPSILAPIEATPVDSWDTIREALVESRWILEEHPRIAKSS